MTETLLAHFEPKPLVIAERFYFHSRSQKSTESIAQYLAELRRLATYCDFKDHLEDALLDRLVCGLVNATIQRHLLSEGNLTVASAVEIAQGMEAADQNSWKLKSADTETVQRVDTGAGNKRGRRPCNRCCGTDYAPSTCRFLQAICQKCQKRGHIAKVCRSSEKPSVSQARKQGTRFKKKIHHIQEGESQELSLFRINQPSSRQPIIVDLEVNDQTIPMELDTGAAVSLISTATSDKLFPDVPLLNTPNALTTYTGERIKVAGKMKVKVRYGDNIYDLHIHVVQGNGPEVELDRLE